MSKEEKEKVCFVIAPIGAEKSEIRTRSDQVLKHVITPAVKECGYKAVRADKISEPGIITSQVIQHLLNDPLVIADLTGHNPNVFYELAVRHAARKPCVHIIQKGEAIPFDVSQSRTIDFDYRDLDSADHCREELIRQIHNVEKDPSDVDSPISVAMDLQMLRQSKNPLETSNAQIISMLQDIRSSMEILRGDTYLLKQKMSALTSVKLEEIDPFTFVKQKYGLDKMETVLGSKKFKKPL